MLFLTDGKAREGSSFCDFIASEEDRNLFIVAMGNETSEEDIAGILPLHLIDSQRREVQVHVHYTSFQDQDDSRYHIIGIAEAETLQGVTRPVEDKGVQQICSTAMDPGSLVSAEFGSEAFER
mmetsp:Transcript_63432/g.176486  ORF Transcript_63432/g.176486 Transcript_63432/m.176486 type:complete len:123 (+) Transcript_63432:1-369(+)